MNRVGVVLDTDGPRARVATSPGGGCATCGEKGACHLALYSPAKEPADDVLEVDNPIGAQPGDSVELELPGGTELGLSGLVWGVPVLGLIGGAVLGALFHTAAGMGQDAAVLLGALLGLVAAYALLRLVDRRAVGSRRLRPRVVRLVRGQACPAASEDLESRS